MEGGGWRWWGGADTGEQEEERGLGVEPWGGEEEEMEVFSGEGEREEGEGR